MSEKPEDLIAGYREWAEQHYPIANGWNTGVDLLLRRAWMDAKSHERAAEPSIRFDGRTPQEFIGAMLFDFQEATGCDTAEEFIAERNAKETR